MEKNFDLKRLDKTTLEFTLNLVWQFEFLCKKTKEGRAMAHAYSQVERVLADYIQKISE